MDSNASQRQPERPDVPSRRPADGGEPRSPPVDPALLEEVLERSLAAGPEALDLSQRQALAEVARRHRGQPLAVEPMVVELVREVLRGQFPVAGGQGLWERLVLQVAESLWDDPAARARLEGLWKRLGGSVL